VYSLTDYLWMIADDTRVAAYAAAIEAQVRPGDHVLEVGAGFGFFSVLAARAGAAHVHAVDTNPAIHLGPKVAAANGCADRITFHHKDVRELRLDRPADVLIADLRGPTPFGPAALAVIIEVRKRLLRPGATMIACQDKVFVAPTGMPERARREIRHPLAQQLVELGPVARVALDTPMRYAIDEDLLLAPGVAWTTVDYATIGHARCSGQAEWTFVQPAGQVDGLALWFESDLGGGIRLSTEPGAALTAYRQLFVPFRDPVALRAGDRLRVELDVFENHDANVWQWRAWRTRPDLGEEQVVHQNSLAEMVIDPAWVTAASTLHRTRI
jgi:hypothetical protein